MDLRAINKAHVEDRKAEKFSHSGRLSDAVFCHTRASKQLSSAISRCDTSQVHDSLALQFQHHIRQELVLKKKVEQLVKIVESNKRKQQRKMSTGSCGSAGVGREVTPVRSLKKKDILITKELNKNMERFDSLLAQLQPFVLDEEPECVSAEDCGPPPASPMHPRIPEVEEEKDVSQEEESHSSTQQANVVPYVKGVKKAKVVETVIEELTVVKKEQDTLINQLFREKEHLEKENATLTLKVRDLQAKLDFLEAEKRHAKVMADSSSSSTTPFVFSPAEYKPHSLPLPELAPLEIPSLDFLDKC